MNQRVTNEATVKAIIENLKHLHFLVSSADASCLEAIHVLQKEYSFAAIESIEDLDAKLRDAWALYRAVVSLSYWRCER